MIDDKVADKIAKASWTSPKHSSGKVENEAEYIGLDIEIPKERQRKEKAERKGSKLLTIYDSCNKVIIEYQKLYIY